MATTIPLVPGLAPLAPRRVLTPGTLKERTLAQLAGHALRRRALAQAVYTPMSVAYHTPTDGPDGLLFWYMQVRQAGEHAALWGECGLSPSQFLQTFAPLPLLLLVQDGAAWRQGEGWLVALWADEWVPGLRARIHFWMTEAVRHPQVSLPLGQQAIAACWTWLGVQELEGRIPVTNRGALRFVRRLGFEPVATLQAGLWLWQADGTKTCTPVVQTQLLRPTGPSIPPEE